VLPQVIADAPNGRGGAWSHDGVILFVPSTASAVMRVSAAGGTPASATYLAAGQRSHRWPAFLPDGKRFLFVSTHGEPGTEGVFLGSLERDAVARVLEDESPAVYAPPGRLVLEREGALVSLPFDPERGAVVGEPTILVRPIGVDTIVRPAFAISETGVFAHRTAVAAQRQLTWIDRSGRIIGPFGPPDDAAIAAPELTRDGRQLAVYRSVDGNADIWRLPVPGGVPSRFTFGSRIDAYPLWSPNSRHLVFTSTFKGVWGVFERATDGSDIDRPLFKKSEIKVALDFSPDGHLLLYAVQVPQTGVDLWAVPMPEAGEDRAFPAVQTPFDEMAGQFSSDGKWLAYQSNATGRIEVYVRAFPGSGNAQQVSVSGGSQPRWSRDGRDLYYIATDGWLMAVPLRVDGGNDRIDAAAPQRLFKTDVATGSNILPAVGSRAQYVVAPDGRFLMNVAVEGAPAPPITVTVNWQAAAATK
jgi:Tol biopolymer transport system component